MVTRRLKEFLKSIISSLSKVVFELLGLSRIVDPMTSAFTIFETVFNNMISFLGNFDTISKTFLEHFETITSLVEKLVPSFPHKCYVIEPVEHYGKKNN